LANLLDVIRANIEDSIAAKQQLLAQESLMADIAASAMRMTAAFSAGNKLLFCGNGGSAADAQHIVAEFTGRFISNDRRPLPAISLATNASAVTAIANDFEYEVIFARQVEALGQAGDVLIGISTSGNSPNVLQAVETAKRSGLHTVSLLGKDGGMIAPACDTSIVVPSQNTQRIQECHIVIGHIWCQLIEHAILQDRT
jgi:D-sedoheptulose 7-phosphate isomerase